MYGILTIGLGAFVLWSAFYVSREVRGKRDWPTVEGQVLERRLEQAGTRPNTRAPKVVYSYTVGGQAYRNDQVYLLAGTAGDKDEMQKVIDGIPDRAPVHYNPGDPKQSYLLGSSMTWFYILLPLGIVLALIGLVLIVGAKETT